MRWAHSIVSSGDPLSVLSLADAKRELDVTFDADDEIITANIASAVDWVQQHTGQFLTETVVDFMLDQTATPLQLPFKPFRTFTSMAIGGVAVTPRVIIGDSLRLLPPLGSGWLPVVQELGAVEIRATFGFAPGTVPPGILRSVRALVRMYYDNPEGASLKQDMDAIERSLIPYRVRNL